MRLCIGQHKKRRKCSVCGGPAIHYEKDKDISPSARDPLLPNKLFLCRNCSPCSNLSIVRVRMTSSAIKNTKSTRLFRNKTSEEPAGPNLASPATVQHYIYQLSQDFRSFFFLSVYCSSAEKRRHSAKISKTLLTSVKIHQS